MLSFNTHSLPSLAQKITLSGYIRDAETKEALIGAAIYETTQQRGATANEYGFYSLTLPAQDTLNVIIFYVGYQPRSKKDSLERKYPHRLILKLIHRVK